MRRRRRGSVSADDDDEERQIARNLWRHMRLLPPTGVWRKRWNKWLLLLVLWNIIFLPLNLCFVRGPDPLSPRELDHLRLAQAGQLAQRRLARLGVGAWLVAIARRCRHVARRRLRLRLRRQPLLLRLGGWRRRRWRLSLIHI